MARTEVVFYAESDGRSQEAKVQDKCLVRIERPAELGHELRRPEADSLRDGIHELRATFCRVHYRILYSFHGGTAVLLHALTKEKAVPPVDMERAKKRQLSYEADPQAHTYQEGKGQGPSEGKTGARS